MTKDIGGVTVMKVVDSVFGFLLVSEITSFLDGCLILAMCSNMMS